MGTRPYLKSIEDKLPRKLMSRRKDIYICSKCLSKTDCEELGLVEREINQAGFCEVFGCGNSYSEHRVLIYRVSVPQLSGLEQLLYLENEQETLSKRIRESDESRG